MAPDPHFEHHCMQTSILNALTRKIQTVYMFLTWYFFHIWTNWLKLLNFLDNSSPGKDELILELFKHLYWLGHMELYLHQYPNKDKKISSHLCQTYSWVEAQSEDCSSVQIKRWITQVNMSLIGIEPTRPRQANRKRANWDRGIWEVGNKHFLNDEKPNCDSYHLPFKSSLRFLKK